MVLKEPYVDTHLTRYMLIVLLGLFGFFSERRKYVFLSTYLIAIACL